MTTRARTLSAFAAGALLTPLLTITASPALAAGEDTPPPPRSIAEFCENVPEDYEPFTDIDGNIFEQNIECLAFAEITQGLSGGNRYGPGLAVTRGQMASFIARMIDTADELDTGDNIKGLPAFDGEDSFIDVQDGYVHRQNIDRLDEADIVEGGPGGRPANIYGPELEVTRAQMASFIKRALEYMTGDSFDTTMDFFTDDENAQPHEPNINAVAAEGIAVGDGSNTYNPFQSVSRGQMAGFLTRTLAVLFENGDISNGVEPEPETPEVTIQDRTAGPGEDIAFTIDSDEIASVTVTGDCIETATYDEDADAAQAGFQVVVPVQEDAEEGTCTITVDFTDNDGNDFSDTFDVEITAEPFDDIVVTPDAEQALQARANPDTVTADDRDYSVSGLEAGVEYRVTLVKADNVQGSGQQATFRASADAASSTGFSADTGSPTADITRVNGTATADSDAAAAGFQAGTTTFTASGTTATFTIDGDAANEAVVPVVYRNGATDRSEAEGGTSPRLEVDATMAGEFAAPVEAFDIGGVTRFGAVTNQTVTVRPELVTATVVRTFSDPGPTGSADDDRQLTEVRFVFDEEVTGKAPTANRFHLVGFDSATRFDGTSATVEQDRKSVLVRFGAPVSLTNPQGQEVGDDEVRETSLATVDFDAVRDVGGAENPIGDDAVGTSRTETRGAAGVTDAPDLQSVSGFTSAAGSSTTQLLFTFDETAFTLEPEGFHLVTINNQDIACTAVDGVEGGQPGDGEQADSTVLVDCPEAALGRNITADDVARGYVDAGTVSDAETGGNTNPLQATQTPDAGSSGPDLVSATFQISTSTATASTVTFTFDEPVLLANDTDTDGPLPTDTDTDGENGELDFRVYPLTGGPGTPANDARRSTSNSNEIIAEFDAADLEEAVGANVEESAVVGATGVANRNNQEDEVGVANEQSTDFTAGQTDGPDLRGVAVTSGSATYTFDEGVADAVTANRFFLDLADGTRLQCSAATVGGATRNTVTCSTYTVLVQDGGQATAAQIASAVLGTVDDDAVRDAGGNTSPEGAEVTTGSTGTPRT